MKLFPKSKLPLKPKGAWEKYSLYAFESRARWLTPNAICLGITLGLWALTQVWIWGLLAGFALIHVILGFEARVVCRMIQRAANPDANKKTNLDAEALTALLGQPNNE
jgi:hypothetical protein